MIRLLVVLNVLVASLFVGITVGSANNLITSKISPGHFEVYSCAETGTMPIINWTRKGWMQIIHLEKSGNCVLHGRWDSSVPGYYCTGIGDVGDEQYVPDQCITISHNPVRKEKFRNVFKYRYLP